MHHNKSAYPKSYQFLPERWLDNQGLRRPNMEQGQLAFSKGSRQCLGIKRVLHIIWILFILSWLTCIRCILARCELYVSTAALAQCVLPHMKIHERTIDDVKYVHKLITAQAKKGSEVVRVVMV